MITTGKIFHCESGDRRRAFYSMFETMRTGSIEWLKAKRALSKIGDI
jgi:hypothetical protein